MKWALRSYARRAAIVVAMSSGTACTNMEMVRIDRIGRALDDTASLLEEYGTISMSAPLLVPGDYPKFKFDLERGASTYFQDARKPQALGGVFEQVSQSSGAGLDVSADLSSLTSYLAGLGQFSSAQSTFRQAEAVRLAAGQRAVLEEAKRIREEAQNGTTAERTAAEARASRYVAENWPVPAAPTPPSVPATPNLTGVTDPVPTPQQASSLVASAAFMKLLESMPDDKAIELSNQMAISIAAANTAHEAIFALLGQPAEAAKFKDKVLLFGVSMVAVRPGWRTQNGYAADLSVIASYDVAKPDGSSKQYRPSLSAGIPEGTDGLAPLIFAVSPMVDADVMDLASGVRRQRAWALRVTAALQFAGLGAKAGAFTDYVKRIERDLATTSASAAISAYSDSGGIVGFQVGPRLRALQDPSFESSRAGYVLERQTFPVLLLIGINRRDLLTPTGGEAPTIVFRQTSRWLPLVPFAGSRLDERRRLHLAAAMNAQRKELASLDPDIRNLVNAKYDTLWYQAFTSKAVERIPAEVLVDVPPALPTLPQIHRVVPDEIAAGSTASVLVAGTNLGRVTRVDLLSTDGEVQGLAIATAAEGLLEVKFQTPATADVAFLRLRYSYGPNEQGTLSPPIVIRRKAPTPAKAIELIQTREDSGAQSKDVIVVPPSASAEVIKSFIERQKPVVPRKDDNK